VVKVPGNTTSSVYTKQTAQRIRIQNYIKYLYKKKQQLNKELCTSHLYNANQWKTLWTQLEQNINEKLNSVIRTKLRNQDQKIQNETNKKQNNISIQCDSSQNKHSMHFYTKLVNNTNITLTISETKLLEKGLKYNLHFKTNTGLIDYSLGS
jgi:hypothetical protein